MTVYTKKDKAVDDLIAYFEENLEIFADVIEDLDSWNGYLGDDRYYEMYMLDDFIKGSSEDVIYWLNRAYYGNDEGQSGSSFCPNKDYFRFNGYGNLESTDYKDYSDQLNNWAILEIWENIEHLDTITEVDNDEMAELFNALTEAMEEENHYQKHFESFYQG